VRDSGVQVAGGECERGAVHLDAGVYRPVRRVVHDDHPGRRFFGPGAVRRAQCVLDVGQPGGDGVELRPLCQRTDEADREHRPGPDHVVGQCLDPASELRFAPLALHHRQGTLHEVGGRTNVAGSQRMAHGLRRIAVRVEPRTGASVQVRDLAAALLPAVGAQHVGE
jgi:hypothetical protein